LGHLGVRNAQLALCREKTLLREQQRQILHDLGASYAEVDRAYQSIRTTLNNRSAIYDEVQAKVARLELEDVFFLLDAIQRAAAIEGTLQRSIVDYNLALTDFALNEGSLLELFNVNLAESNAETGIVVDLGAPAGSELGPAPAPLAPPGNAPVVPEAPADAPIEQPAPMPQGAAAIISIPALERRN
jgi:hypothetical protein